MKDHRNLRYLTEAYKRGKLSQAYIIEGLEERKTCAFADQLAQALLCDRIRQTLQKGDGLLRPCGTCPACIKAKSGNHPDLIRVSHEKDTVLAVGEIREQVVEDIAIKPCYGPYKIYIIAQAQLMNEQAQNALLKTIEEPREYALILLLTDNADGFLPTIRSRCIRLRMEDPSREEAIQELLDDDGVRAMEIICQAPYMTAAQISNACKELSEMNWQNILRIFQIRIRDLLVCKSTGDDRRLYYRQDPEELRRLSGTVSYEALNHMLKAWEQLSERLKARVRIDAACETFLLQIRRCAGYHDKTRG